MDLAEGCVFQDGSEVATKGSKTFTTWFVPVDDVCADCLAAWIKELREGLHFGPADPLFPKVEVKGFGFDGFRAVGLSRFPYSTEGRLPLIIKGPFAAAGLPAFTPHRFRNALVQMSNDYVTTVDDYGRVSSDRQGEVTKRLREKVGKSRSES